MSHKHILIFIFSVLAIVVIYDFVRAYVLIQRGKILAEQALPFERYVPEAQKRILIAGDSTGVGTGASSPSYTTAGYLGSKYPDAEIINISVNGLKLSGLIDKLNENDLGSFDIVVAQIGANDILRLTDLRSVETNFRDVLAKLSEIGNAVFVLHSGRVGEAPLFPIYVGHIFTKRAQLFRKLYTEVSREFSNVMYVDLMAGDSDALFKENPKKYYARDGLHLSDAGYLLWYKEIESNIDGVGM